MSGPFAPKPPPRGGDRAGPDSAMRRARGGAPFAVLRRERKTAIAACVALVIAIACVALASGSGTPQPDAWELVAADAPSADGAAAPVRPGALGSDVRIAVERNAATAEPAVSRGGPRLEVPRVPGSVGPMLHVVEARSGRPVAGAEVFAAEAPRGRGRRPGDPEGHWAEALLARVRPSRTDAEGNVPLPTIERQLLVAARAPGLFGTAVVPHGARDGVRLALESDHALQVRVLGPEGAPLAGVTVLLCIDQGLRLDRKTSASSGADGLAVLPHVQLYRDKLPLPNAELAARQLALQQEAALLAQGIAAAQGASRDDPSARAALAAVQRRQAQVRSGLRQVAEARDRDVRRQLGGAGRAALPDADFVVLAQVPELAPAFLRVPSTAPPRRTLELRVGVTGSLVVRLRGPDARALQTACTIEVRTAGDAPPPPVIAPELAPSLRSATSVRVEKPIGTDEVRFPWIGAGQRLDVRVRFADDDFDFGQRGVEGPHGSEPRVVEIETPGWFTVVAGRLVAADGVPLGGARADMFLAGRQGRVEAERLVTAADGTFELPVRLRRPAPPYTLDVLVQIGETACGTLRPLPALDPGRRHELGDVTLLELATVAWGTVRDDRGQPVADATVSLQALREDGRGRPRWHDEPHVTTRSGRDGSYRLLGAPREDRLRLVPRAPHHAAVAQPEIRFGQEQDLVLERLAEIRGDGYLPDWMPRGVVRLQLLSAAAGGRQIRDVELNRRGDGSFRFRLNDLRAGRYAVRIVLRGVPRPLLVVPDVVVAPGERADDARLHGIELRYALFRFVVRAVDAKGEAVRPNSPLLVRMAGEDGDMRWVGYSWRGAEVEFFATDPSVEAVGLASGRRPQRTRLQAGENRILLQQLHPVHVHLPGLRQLLGNDRRARISLVYVGDTGLPMDDVQAIDQRRGQERRFERAQLGKSGGGWLGPDDRVTMRLMLNGPYRVVLRVSQDGVPGGAASRPLGTVHVVLDGPEPATVTLAPRPDVVRQAVGELASRQAEAAARGQQRR